MTITDSSITRFVTGGARLPSAYQEVEYLQSSGNQYINTGVSGVVDFEANAQFTQGGSASQILVSTGISAGQWIGQSGGRWIGTILGNVVSTDYTKIIANFSPQLLTATANGVSIGGAHNITSYGTWTLFWRNNFPTYLKLYDCQFSQNGSLVRNFIPCYRKSDSVAGMYDLVSGTFYTNAGTGSFIVGEDVTPQTVIDTCKTCFVVGGGSRLPSAYQEVEYLQSSGTQYIDTNYIPTRYTGLKIDAQSTGYIGNTFDTCVGSRGTSNSRFYPFTNVNESKFRSGLSNQFFNWDISTDRTQIDFNINADGKIIKNGTLFDTLSESSLSAFQVATRASIGIFATHAMDYANQWQWYGAYKLYSLGIYENGVLVGNFIPCYRKSDSVAGMYDLVNGVFYTNQGTGSFIVGEDVNPLQVITTYATKFVTND